MALTENDEMPFGKYAGVPMCEIPANYLIWLFENKKCYGEVLTYIVDNMEQLKNECKAKNN